MANTELQAWVTLKKDILTALAAIIGLQAWKQQLRGKTEYELAQRLAKAAYRFRNEIAGYRTAFSTLYQIMREGDGTPSDPKEWLGTAASIHEKHWQRIEEASEELDGISLEAEAIWGESIRKRIADLRQYAITLNGTWQANYWRLEVPSANPDEKFDNQVMVVIYKIPAEDNWFSKGLAADVSSLTNYLKRYLKL